MYGNPVKSPFPSHSTGRGEAAVNNRYIARGRNGESREEKIPCTRTTFLSLSASCLQYFMHSFSPASFFCPPHLSSVRLNLLYFLALSVLFLLFLRAWWMIAERKRWNWMPPSKSFPLRLVGDFVLLEWVVTAHWLTIIQNINCQSRPATVLRNTKSWQQEHIFL